METPHWHSVDNTRLRHRHCARPGRDDARSYRCVPSRRRFWGHGRARGVDTREAVRADGTCYAARDVPVADLDATEVSEGPASFTLGSSDPSYTVQMR
jgi:hypothetical protein